MNARNYRRRRVRFPSPTQSDRSDEPVEAVFDADHCGRCSQAASITLERTVLALQEYLRDIADLDAQVSNLSRH